MKEGVARWAPMIWAACLDLGLSGDALFDTALVTMCHLHVESGGDPTAYNLGSSATGLMQLTQWLGARGRWYGGPERGKPFIHPEATIAGHRVTFDPEGQFKAAVSILRANWRRSRHWPSASQAYASGGGTVSQSVKAGRVVNFEHQFKKYIPTVYLHLIDQYGPWLAGWTSGGMDSYKATMTVGRGESEQVSNVVLAPVHSVSRVDGWSRRNTLAFDGKLCWDGKCVLLPVWEDAGRAYGKGSATEAPGDVERPSAGGVDLGVSDAIWADVPISVKTGAGLSALYLGKKFVWWLMKRFRP